MDDLLLRLSLPHQFEGIDGSARSEGARGVAVAIFAKAPTRDPLLLTQRLASPALAILARWGSETPPGGAVRGGSERQFEHDSYFGVQRLTSADPLLSFGEATLVVYYRLMLDSLRGHSLSPLEHAHLHEAFEATVSILAGAPASGGADPAASLSSTGTLPRTSVNALLRWKRGHQSFFILIQALIIAHARLAAALDQNLMPAAQEAFSLTTLLWRGTATAFRYTADFPAEDYEHIVRPSMQPPFLKDGFSGVFSTDHVHLFRAIRAMQPSFQKLPSELVREHQLYLQALDASYQAHAFVCERFVEDGKSLKASKSSLASGPTTIRRDLRARALWSAGGRPDE